MSYFRPEKMLFKDLNRVLQRLLVDFDAQEKEFLNHVEDLNMYDMVLRKAQIKVYPIMNEQSFDMN